MMERTDSVSDSISDGLTQDETGHGESISTAADTVKRGATWMTSLTPLVLSSYLHLVQTVVAESLEPTVF